MVKTLQKRKESGFTIIEVLIVLAIAGLILLVVFLAVPALNRSSRNTTIKNDAASLAGGISEYISNNDGQLPGTPLAQSGSTVTVGLTATNQAEVKVNSGTTVNTAKKTPVSSDYVVGTLFWNTGTTCSGTTASRAATVYYFVESTGTSHVVRCVDAS